MEHGIRTMAESDVEKLMKRSFKKGLRATAKACLNELNRRARRDQATIVWSDAA